MNQSTNDITTMKRIKVSEKCANPLFVEWLEEWRDEAASRGSEMQYCFAKALKSMNKCPIRLKRGRDCIALRYFGNKLCRMLDKKLSEWESGRVNDSVADHNGGDNDDKKIANSLKECRNDLNAVNVNLNVRDRKVGSKKAALVFEEGRKIFNKIDDDDDDDEGENNVEPAVKKSRTRNAAKGKKNVRDNIVEDVEIIGNRNGGCYVPGWRSGGYAILLTLYEKTLDPEYVGYTGKADLQLDAQKYCDKSLKKTEPGNRYTAWSSMSMLIEKGLVAKKNTRPARYGLTDAGLETALRLYEIGEENDQDDLAGSKNNFGDSKTCAKKDADKNNDGSRYHAVKTFLGSSFVGEDRSPDVYDKEIGTNSDDDKNRHTKKENERSETVVTIGRDRDVDELEARNDEDNGSPKRCFSHSSGNDDHTLVLPPRTFDVLLIIDDRETAGGKVRPKDDPTITELAGTGIKYEVKNLKIGDFVWIARSRINGEELVLPYVVERKRIDDFGSSIKDGRYYEQKFRLKRSGIKNVTYLVENHGNNQHSVLPMNTLFQAAINTLVQDNFIVKWTNCHKDSMIYLASMTQMLNRIYQEKTLVACKKEDLINGSAGSVDDDSIRLMYFDEFNKSAAKIKTFKSREMLIRQLIQLKGISVEKALAIVDIYPTPLALKKAYDKGGENLLAGIKFGRTKRQIGPALSKTLHQFYTRDDF